MIMTDLINYFSCEYCKKWTCSNNPDLILVKLCSKPCIFRAYYDLLMKLDKEVLLAYCNLYYIPQSHPFNRKRTAELISYSILNDILHINQGVQGSGS